MIIQMKTESLKPTEDGVSKGKESITSSIREMLEDAPPNQKDIDARIVERAIGIQRVFMKMVTYVNDRQKQMQVKERVPWMSQHFKHYMMVK